MNYLIKIIALLLFFISETVISAENEIIFKINEKIYTLIDFNNRIEFLEYIDSSNLELLSDSELIDDYFRAAIFLEYVKNNNDLKKTIENEIKKIVNSINNNNPNNSKLNEETIKSNIKINLARKIVIEQILNEHTEYIFSNPDDLRFIYSYKLKYLTIPRDNTLSEIELEKILNLEKLRELDVFLSQNNINFHLNEKEINDLSKIDKKIKNLMISSNKFLYSKNMNFYRIVYVDKKLDISKGLFYRLINFETDKLLTNNQENCNFVKSLNDIKSSNEYEYNKINEKIKNNLKSINDFIIFQTKNKFNYVFLCEIRVNQEFLKEININKKINIVAKSIESDFIYRFSKLYNAQKYYE